MSGSDKEPLLKLIPDVLPVSIKKYSIPFISIILFIIVLTLNAIQYDRKDRMFLQNKILPKMKYNYKIYEEPKPAIQNFLLIFYKVIGINSLIKQSLWYILYILVSWGLMSLIEMNIGHISFIYFIIMIFGISFLIDAINSFICVKGLYNTNLDDSLGACCGSQIMWSALGFVLMLYLLKVTNKYIKLGILLVIIITFISLICSDKYYSFKGEDNSTCDSLTWHVLYFLFGLFSGYVIGK